MTAPILLSTSPHKVNWNFSFKNEWHKFIIPRFSVRGADELNLHDFTAMEVQLFWDWERDQMLPLEATNYTLVRNNSRGYILNIFKFGFNVIIKMI